MKILSSLCLVFALFFAYPQQAFPLHPARTAIVNFFQEIVEHHSCLKDELIAFLEELKIDLQGEKQEEMWKRYDDLTSRLKALKAQENFVLQDVQTFSRTYFDFCVSIDDVTDKKEVSTALETRLGTISDTLKEIAALIEGKDKEEEQNAEEE